MPFTLQSGAFQDLAAYTGDCYGCGPHHPTGLHIKSRWAEDGETVIAEHTPREEFHGWKGLVYGGFLAMLVDCHSNWTVMAHHYRAEDRELGTLPAIECVTANLNIRYLAPTPMGHELKLKAKIDGEVGRKTKVICEIWCGELCTVRAESLFVRVDVDKIRNRRA